ncbi:unnamed protein product, partial [Allacma fusca]
MLSLPVTISRNRRPDPTPPRPRTQRPKYSP